MVTREEIARAICCAEHGGCILKDCDPEGDTTACIALKGYHDKTIDAVVALLPAQEWQDISTLPEEYKSGRKDFLVRFNSGHIDHVYLTIPEPPLAQTYRYCGGGMSGQQAGWPDHWMPRPTDPVAVIADERAGG